MVDRFSEFRQKNNFYVEHVDEGRLELCGGGNFYGEDGLPDDATTRQAEEIAEKFGMVITSSLGTWRGYSEYTPDPGDVSIFYWERIDDV